MCSMHYSKLGNAVAYIWCNVLYKGHSADISVLSLITLKINHQIVKNIPTNQHT